MVDLGRKVKEAEETRAGEGRQRAGRREPRVKRCCARCPNLVRLIARLVTDPTLPARGEDRAGAPPVYLASPLDLVPDFIPLAGLPRRPVDRRRRRRRAAELRRPRARPQVLAGHAGVARADRPRRPHAGRLGPPPPQGPDFRGLIEMGAPTWPPNPPTFVAPRRSRGAPLPRAPAAASTWPPSRRPGCIRPRALRFSPPCLP